LEGIGASLSKEAGDIAGALLAVAEIEFACEPGEREEDYERDDAGA
jgi:hypothetical protein